MRAAVKLLLLSLLAFAVAFVLRRMFFWNVMPISWDQEMPPTGELETAFLLLSVQNTAAVTAVIALAAGLWLWIVRYRKAAPGRDLAAVAPSRPRSSRLTPKN